MSERTLVLCGQRFVISDYHKAVFVCFVTFLSTAYTSVYPFTYLPDMIRWFGYNEVEKGYYAGFIASAYFAGSGLFSYFWGWLSDRKGRRPVLVFQLVCTGVFCLIYGFCGEFYTALAIRFLDGAVNGVTSVVNAILYDHSNNENQAFAASLVATAWGIGVCVGPLIAGYLATPAIKYPASFDIKGMFGSFPYLIPSFVGFVLAMVSAVVVLVLLPKKASAVTSSNEFLYDSSIELTDFIENDDHAVNSTNCHQKHNPENQKNTRINERRCLKTRELNREYRNGPIEPPRERAENDLITDDERTSICKHNQPKGYGLYQNIINSVNESNLWDIIRYPGIRLVLFACSLYAFATIGYWEILPVWLSTSRSLGGLDFNSDNIGLVMGTVTMIGLVLQSFLVVQLEKRVGAIVAYIVFAMLFCIMLQVTSFVRLLRDDWTLWLVIYVNSIAISTALPACNAILTMITNNCSPAEHVGAVNGLAQTLAAIFRAAAPVVGGNIFAASINSSLGPPFDPSTVFVFFAIVFWISVIAVYFLPRNLNTQNKGNCTQTELTDQSQEHRDENPTRDFAFETSRT